LALAVVAQAAEPNEARLSLDVKDADATEVVAVLARAADKQPVFQPGISCRLTLRVKGVEWRVAMAAVLDACRLGVEEEGSVLRVAPLDQLARERSERAALVDKQQAAPRGGVAAIRLSHARAAEIAPILQKLLPRGQVSYDARTNTLLITY
jgi:type IV pilus assembly protein PilQ